MTTKKIFLLVDDDPEDREIFRDVLSSLDNDIEVWESPDGEDALQTLSSAQDIPVIIFLDLNMPKVNGFEFLKKIKQSSRHDHIPVHIYSTSSNQSDIQTAAQLGASNFIVKTSSIPSLKNVLTLIINALHHESGVFVQAERK